MNIKADFEQLFRDSPYPTVVLANNLTIVHANNAFLRSAARTADDLRGCHVKDAFPENPHDVDSTYARELQDSMATAINTAMPHTTVLLRYAMPGEMQEGETFESRYWRIVHTPILAEDGTVACLCQSAIDVTAFNNSITATVPWSAGQLPEDVQYAEILRGQMYEAMARILNDEQSHLSNLFHQSPGFVALMIGSRQVLAMGNEAYYQLVGRHTPMGKSIWEALPALAGQGYEEIFNEVYTTGKPWVGHDLRMAIQREAGGAVVERFVDLTCQPYHGIDGGILGIFLQGYDVTDAHESRLVREAHRGTEERLQHGIRAAKMMVWDWEMASRQLLVSDNIKDVLGRTADSIEALFQFFRPEDAAKLHAAHQRVVEECSEYREIVRFTRPDNGKKLWLDIQGKALCDTTGQVYAMRGVIMDITERMEAEEYLHKANRQKDEFLAMLAHELRNPLAPISSSAQLIKSGKLDDTTLGNASDIIIRQVTHMSELIEDLMDVSRVTRGVIKLDRDSVDIKAVIADAIEQTNPIMAIREHHLRVELCTQKALVLGDKERLIQVLSNILNNAAKYTITGGNIVLRLEVDSEQVLITVSDDGIGISEELLPHVFELFTQAERPSDRAQGGLGVGLSLVKSLIELHGGKVTVVSEGPDKGAEFTICLPRLLQDAPAVNPDLEKEGAPGTALTIMLVDDNADAALTLAMLLEFEGHQVIVENNARAALKRLESYRPEVFLIDIGLPEMDGNELARILRSQPQTAQATFIAITGYGQEADKAKTRLAGFDHHLVKPLDLTKLKSLLSRPGHSSI